MDNEKAGDEQAQDADNRDHEGAAAPSADRNAPADVPQQDAQPQDQPPTHQYFVSYSRTEYYFTRELVDRLRKNGLDIWFDQQQLLPGIEWKSEIDSGLENCVGLILVVSRASLRSANVAYEWQSAMWQDKPIYLVLSEAVDIGKIELKSDDIDVTQYSLEDLVRYARKIIDLRRWFDRRTSLLAKHILEGKAIHGIPTIPKPGFFGLQLSAPMTVWSVALLFMLAGFLNIVAGILLTVQFFLAPDLGAVVAGLICIFFGYILLKRGRSFLARDEFSIAQMRLLTLLSFLSPAIVLIPLGIYVLFQLTFLRNSILRWLKRYAVENTILEQSEVKKRMGGILLPNIVPGLAFVGLLISAVVWVWYRLTEPPLRLRDEDQKKVPPTYDVLCAEVDSRLANKIEKALKLYKMKRVDKAASDMTIAIITNHSNEAFLQRVLATQNRLVVILATSIVSNEYIEELQKLQWFDYRTHKDAELYDLARTIFSQDYSYLRGLPPSVGTIILPRGVKGIVTLVHLAGSLHIVVGGGVIGGVVKLLLTQNLTLPMSVLMILLGGLSIWSGWRIIIETGNILNRRLSRNRQVARLSVSFLPALGAALVLIMGESMAVSNAAPDFFTLVTALPLSALFFMLLIFMLAVAGNPNIWFPTQTLAKDDQSGILFNAEDTHRKWRPFLYSSAVCGILLGVAALVGAAN